MDISRVDLPSVCRRAADNALAVVRLWWPGAAYLYPKECKGLLHVDPDHFAHTLVEVAGPPVCGGGTTANVGEGTCAMGWAQCCGSRTKGARIGVLMGTRRDMGAKEAKEG